VQHGDEVFAHNEKNKANLAPSPGCCSKITSHQLVTANRWLVDVVHGGVVFGASSTLPPIVIIRLLLQSFY